MKKIFSTIAQFVLFLVAFAAGSILPLFIVRFPSVVTRWAGGTRGFQWDGILLMLILLVLSLVIEAAAKRIRSSAPWTLVAFVLAAAAGLLMKFGFMTLPPL